MPETLTGRKVAILVTDGFEEVELTEPRKALDQDGAQTTLIAPAPEKVRAGTTASGATSSGSTCRSNRPTRTGTTRCCCRAA